MSNVRTLVRVVLVASLVTGASGTAVAQETVAQGDEAAPAYVVAPATLPAGERIDGVRFRRGVALTLGGEFVPDVDFSATMYGLDARFGVQINHLLGVYTQTHLSFGSGSIGSSAGGSTGTFGFLLMADATFSDMFFAGAGFGYVIFNNPGGMAVALRGGLYPLKSAREDRALRRGLMVSLESRFVFLGDPYSTGIQIMAAVGYEVF